MSIFNSCPCQGSTDPNADFGKEIMVGGDLFWNGSDLTSDLRTAHEAYIWNLMYAERTGLAAQGLTSVCEVSPVWGYGDGSGGIAGTGGVSGNWASAYQALIDPNAPQYIATSNPYTAAGFICAKTAPIQPPPVTLPEVGGIGTPVTGVTPVQDLPPNRGDITLITDRLNPTPHNTTQSPATLPGTIITEYLCDSASGSTSTTTTTDSRCAHPLYALDTPATCGVITAKSLRLDSASGSVGVGLTTAFRAVATFSTGQEADVSNEANYTVGDVVTASRLGGGYMKGVAVGTTAIKATWNNLSATASLTVTDSTSQLGLPWDVVFILDEGLANYIYPHERPSLFGSQSTDTTPPDSLYFRRGVYNTGAAPATVQLYTDYIDVFARSMRLKTLIDPTSAGVDKLSVIFTGDGSPYVAVDWTDSVPESSYSKFATAVQGVSRLGAAVNLAHKQMQLARANARKLVVLLTPGVESLCDPPLSVTATALRVTAGVPLGIITPAQPTDVVYCACSYPQTAHASLVANASSGCFVGSVTSRTMFATLSSFLSTVIGTGINLRYGLPVLY